MLMSQLVIMLKHIYIYGCAGRTFLGEISHPCASQVTTHVLFFGHKCCLVIVAIQHQVYLIEKRHRKWTTLFCVCVCVCVLLLCVCVCVFVCVCERSGAHVCDPH